LIDVEESNRKGKKYVATFKHGDDKTERIHFGAKGMEDYTLTGDKAQRERYRARAYKGATAKPNSAAALSYWVLWGDSKSMRKNLREFIRKYDL